MSKFEEEISQLATEAEQFEIADWLRITANNWNAATVLFVTKSFDLNEERRKYLTENPVRPSDDQQDDFFILMMNAVIRLSPEARIRLKTALAANELIDPNFGTRTNVE